MPHRVCHSTELPSFVTTTEAKADFPSNRELAVLAAAQILRKPEMVSAHEEQLGEELAVYEMARSGAHKGPCDDKFLQKEMRVSVEMSAAFVFSASTSNNDNDS